MIFGQQLLHKENFFKETSIHNREVKYSMKLQTESNIAEPEEGAMIHKSKILVLQN